MGRLHATACAPTVNCRSRSVPVRGPCLPHPMLWAHLVGFSGLPAVISSPLGPSFGFPSKQKSRKTVAITPGSTARSRVGADGTRSGPSCPCARPATVESDVSVHLIVTQAFAWSVLVRITIFSRPIPQAHPSRIERCRYVARLCERDMDIRVVAELEF